MYLSPGVYTRGYIMSALWALSINDEMRYLQGDAMHY